METFPKYLPVAYSTFGCMCMEDCSVPSLCTIHHSTCSLHILSEVRVFLYKYSFSQHLDLEKHEKPYNLTFTSCFSQPFNSLSWGVSFHCCYTWVIVDLSYWYFLLPIDWIDFNKLFFIFLIYYSYLKFLWLLSDFANILSYM